MKLRISVILEGDEKYGEYPFSVDGGEETVLNSVTNGTAFIDVAGVNVTEDATEAETQISARLDEAKAKMQAAAKAPE